MRCSRVVELGGAVLSFLDEALMTLATFFDSYPSLRSETKFVSLNPYLIAREQQNLPAQNVYRKQELLLFHKIP